MTTDDLDGWLSAADAARLAGVSRPRIHQLVAANVLEARHVAGRLVVHRAILEMWIGSRDRRRCWKPSNLSELRVRRDEILALAAAHGARNVRVFGSVASGTATPTSDLDLAVDMDEGRNALDVCALMVDLEDAVGRSIDIVARRSPDRAHPRLGHPPVSESEAPSRTPDREERHLRVILLSTQRIERYRPATREEFLSDVETQDAISWRLQSIADAARHHLSDDLKARHPGIPWRSVYGFRNIAAHGYADLNMELVWEVVTRHLAALRKAVEEELSRRGQPGQRE